MEAHMNQNQSIFSTMLNCSTNDTHQYSCPIRCATTALAQIIGNGC